MATDRPALSLPRRPARRAVSSSSTLAAGPSTSTPVQTHTSRSSAALSYSFTNDGGASENQGSTSSRLSLAAPRKSSRRAGGGDAESPYGGSILELDQHNNSSIALSPRTAPKRRQQRQRQSSIRGPAQPRSNRRSLANVDADTINGDISIDEVEVPRESGPAAKSGVAARANANGIPSSNGILGQVATTSTPFLRPSSSTSALVRNNINDSTSISVSTASTSGIVGPESSNNFPSHPVTSSPFRDHQSQIQSYFNNDNGTGIDEDLPDAAGDGEDDEEEEAAYYSEGSSTETTWELVDRMRIWRNDALNQHLYSTAIFWGSKVFTKTRNPNDGFWLAQAYFVAGMFSRAERVLVGGWEVEETGFDVTEEEGQDEQNRRRAAKGKQRQRDTNDNDVEEYEMSIDAGGDHSMHQTEELRSSGTERGATTVPLKNGSREAPTTAPSQASTLKANGKTAHLVPPQTAEIAAGPPLLEDRRATTRRVRLTDTSVACRYLAAQAMVRQEKWSAAMEMLGEVNPFKSLRSKHRYSNGAGRETGDGGIKFEASMCHLRGLVQLHLNASERAKECFMEALSIDVKCYDSFEALVSGHMMDVYEEWNFIQGLSFKQHTPEDAEFIRMMYTIRLRKVDHREEMERCGRALMDDYGLGDDPDVMFGLADELYSAMRYADCYDVTSRILEMHDSHAAAYPLHLACMHHLPNLRSKLFLIAHELVDREPDSVISWYAVGLWYFSGKKWEESRRFFGKSLLLDNRFGPSWLSFAHSFAFEGEHDQAITAYSTAQRHFQGSHLPILFIGMQYIQLSNIKAAQEYLEASYSICQTDPLLLNELGIINYYNEDYENALTFFSAALQHAESMQSSPSPWAQTHLNIGHVYRKLKDYRRAITSFERSIELSPSQSTAHTGKACCLMMLGENEEAILSLHDALALHPGEPITTSLLKMAMQDAVANQTLKSMSMSGSMRFPLLSDVASEDMDAKVMEDEMKYFGKVLRMVPGTGSGNGSGSGGTAATGPAITTNGDEHVPNAAAPGGGRSAGSRRGGGRGSRRTGTRTRGA